ncbi:Uncharacterised protein [Serratia rubidaea]|nr:Uncharacterised protein [Serratia rubidaea]
MESLDYLAYLPVAIALNLVAIVAVAGISLWKIWRRKLRA